jgi:hypothetical protein
MYPMEDLLKFSYSLELSRDTRKIILDMVRSMQSLFHFNPVFTNRQDGVDYAAVMEHTAEILELVSEKQEIFDGIINPDDLEKYVKAASDFEEIGDQIEKLRDSVREYQNLACYLTYKLTLMIKEHLEMTCPDDCQSLHEKLSGLNRPVPDAFVKVESKLRVV